jgi:hypothetical protein
VAVADPPLFLRRLWGAPQIHGELLKLGLDIGQTSVGPRLVQKLKLLSFARLCTRNCPSSFERRSNVTWDVTASSRRLSDPHGEHQKALIPEVLEYFDHTGKSKVRIVRPVPAIVSEANVGKCPAGAPLQPELCPEEQQTLLAAGAHPLACAGWLTRESERPPRSRLITITATDGSSHWSSHDKTIRI